MAIIDKLKQEFFGEPEATFLDRLREGAIISPDGQRFDFLFDTLEREQRKKVTLHEYPFKNKPDATETGKTGQRFPLDIYFVGNQYDRIADKCFDALLNKGLSRLIHPRWGNREGEIVSVSQREDFIGDLGRSLLRIDFAEATLPTYPTSVASAESKSRQLENKLKDQGGASAVTVKDFVESMQDAANKVLKPAANLQRNVKDKFDQVFETIETALDIINDAIGVYQTFQDLISYPGKLIGLLEQKIESLSDFLDSVISSGETENTPAGRKKALQASLFAGATVSSVFTGYFFSGNDLVTKNDVTVALDNVDSFFSRFDNFVNSKIELYGGNLLDGQFNFPQDFYRTIISLRENTKNWLIDRSFLLKAEKIITLTSERHFVELCYELYGTSSQEQLDFFVSTNNLKGEEFFVLPLGREIKYYV